MGKPVTIALGGRLRVLFAPRLISILDSTEREVRLSPKEAAELLVALSEHFAFEATAGKNGARG
jgi:hypothetical protein